MDEMLRDFYTKPEVDDKFGGMILEKISKADFDALTEKDPNTIYYVYEDSGKVTQYIGDAELSSGSGTLFGQAKPLTTGAVGAYPYIAGITETEE